MFANVIYRGAKVIVPFYDTGKQSLVPKILRQQNIFYLTLQSDKLKTSNMWIFAVPCGFDLCFFNIHQRLLYINWLRDCSIIESPGIKVPLNSFLRKHKAVSAHWKSKTEFATFC